MLLRTATPRPERAVINGATYRHWQVIGSHFSTVSKTVEPLYPPTTYKDPFNTAIPTIKKSDLKKKNVFVANQHLLKAENVQLRAYRMILEAYS